MLVRNRMTPNPTTVRPESDPMAAQTILRYGKFGRLPVVDGTGKLVGIVTDADLDLFFSTVPSPGVVKRQYRVDQVMKSPVITVPPDYPLEEAAERMLEHKVRGLPVVQEDQLVGIITSSDILSQIVDALGGGTASLRVTIRVPDRPGQFARVTARIAAQNGNICSVLSARAGQDVVLTMRLQGIEYKKVAQIIHDLDEIELVHAWENREPIPSSE